MSWSPKQLTRKQMEERRMEGAKLLRQGKMTQEAIAQRLGVSRIRVNQWQGQHKAKGLKGLKAQVSSGRPSKLTTAQQQKLVQLLGQGAIAAGFATERWTLPPIRQVIRKGVFSGISPQIPGSAAQRLGLDPANPPRPSG